MKPTITWRTCITALLVFGLTGCATQAQKQAEAIAENTTTADAAYQACNAAWYNSPAFTPIRARMPLDPDHAVLKQLADTSYATDEEVEVLLDTQPAYVACRTALSSQIAATTPSLVPILNEMFRVNDAATMLLVQRKFTWGQFVTALRDIQAVGKQKIAAEAGNINRQLAEANAAEVAKRQAFVAALQAAAAASSAQTRINQTGGAVAPPALGTHTHCNSYQNGPWTSTDCY